MQVFNVYFKVIKKNLPQMMIFFVVFVALSIAFVNVGIGKISTEFTSSKPVIAIFSQDNETDIIEGLREYLGNNTNIVEIANNEEAKQDALFFRKVTYILQIPAGFTEDLLKGKNTDLGQLIVPDSNEAIYLEQLIGKFCNMVSVYAGFAPAFSQTEIISMVISDLNISSGITMKDLQPAEIPNNNSIYFFNYFAYSLFAIIILGVSSFMITFRDTDLRRRNNSSPISLRSMNFQLVLANTAFAMMAWAILFGLSFVLFRRSMLNINTVYYAINTIIYTVVCVSISFLVGNLTRSRGAQAAIVNVLVMGLSFISGVFVPQFMLSDTVLRIASFTPTYWYIRANNLIDGRNMSSGFSLQFISKEMLIQIAFTLGLFIIAVFVVRYKNTEPSLK